MYRVINAASYAPELSDSQYLFLTDLAQTTELFSYGDISNFSQNLTAEEKKELNILMKRLTNAARLRADLDYYEIMEESPRARANGEAIAALVKHQK